MGFNSAFKGLKLLKTPGNGRLKNLNDLVRNVLSNCSPPGRWSACQGFCSVGILPSSSTG